MVESDKTRDGDRFGGGLRITSHPRTSPAACRIEAYEREFAERDRLDAQMDAMVSSLSSRVEQLERQITEAGLTPEALPAPPAA